MTSHLKNDWDYDKFMYPDDSLKDIEPRIKYKRPNVDKIARDIRYSKHRSDGDFEYNNTSSQILLFSF